MEFKKKFFKGIFLAAFFTLFLYESAELCSALSPVSPKFDGYCILVARPAPLVATCQDSGCEKQKSTSGTDERYQCRYVAKTDKIDEFCDCTLTESLN